MRGDYYTNAVRGYELKKGKEGERREQRLKISKLRKDLENYFTINGGRRAGAGGEGRVFLALVFLSAVGIAPAMSGEPNISQYYRTQTRTIYIRSLMLPFLSFSFRIHIFVYPADCWSLILTTYLYVDLESIFLRSQGHNYKPSEMEKNFRAQNCKFWNTSE